MVVPLDENETGGSLFDKLSAAGAKLCAEVLEKLENGTAVFEKQPELSTTDYAAMIDKKMGEDQTGSARQKRLNSSSAA